MSDKAKWSANAAPALDPGFVADLRCPLTRRPLVQRGNALYCYDSRKAYRIENGIPVLLIEEALDIPESEMPSEYRGKPAVTAPDS